jgi:hypothetical protein
MVEQQGSPWPATAAVLPQRAGPFEGLHGLALADFPVQVASPPDCQQRHTDADEQTLHDEKTIAH